MSFGKNLQCLRRLHRNLTQEGLAEKLDVSRQIVSKWETDEAMPEEVISSANFLALPFLPV